MQTLQNWGLLLRCTSGTPSASLHSVPARETIIPATQCCDSQSGTRMVQAHTGAAAQDQHRLAQPASLARIKTQKARRASQLYEHRKPRSGIKQRHTVENHHTVHVHSAANVVHLLLLLHRRPANNCCCLCKPADKEQHIDACKP